MKNAYVFALLFVVICVSFADAQSIGSLLQNRVLVRKQIKCTLKQGPCDLIGKQIMAVLPEALNNGCRRCKPQDKEMAKEIISFMRKTYPDDWKQIVQKWGNKRG